MTRGGAVVAHLVWAATALAALGLLSRGLWLTVYLEPTRSALSDASSGRTLILTGSCLLLADTGALLWLDHGKTLGMVAVVLVAAPAVACGGLTALAPGSLLPQLAALILVPTAVVAVVLVIVGAAGGSP